MRTGHGAGSLYDEDRETYLTMLGRANLREHGNTKGERTSRGSWTEREPRTFDVTVWVESLPIEEHDDEEHTIPDEPPPEWPGATS